MSYTDKQKKKTEAFSFVRVCAVYVRLVCHRQVEDGQNPNMP